MRDDRVLDSRERDSAAAVLGGGWGVPIHEAVEHTDEPAASLAKNARTAWVIGKPLGGRRLPGAISLAA